MVLPDYLEDGTTNVVFPHASNCEGGTSDGSVYGGICTEAVFNVYNGGSTIDVGVKGCSLGYPTSSPECPTTPAEWGWLDGGAEFTVSPGQNGTWNSEDFVEFGPGLAGGESLAVNPEPSTFGLAAIAIALVAGLGCCRRSLR